MIQKFEFGFIQFKKIFIQLENQGIGHHYSLVLDKQLDDWQEVLANIMLCVYSSEDYSVVLNKESLFFNIALIKPWQMWHKQTCL